MTNHPPSAAAHTLAASGPQAWLSRLWRLLAIGLVLGSLGGCYDVLFKGDLKQPAQSTAGSSIKVEAEQSLNNERLYKTYIVLEKTTDRAQKIAYTASVKTFPNASTAPVTSTFTALQPSAIQLNATRTNDITIATAANAATPLSLILKTTQLMYSARILNRATTGTTERFEVPLDAAMANAVVAANPGFELRSFIVATSFTTIFGDTRYFSYPVDITSPKAQLDKVALTRGPSGLSGNTVTASFTVSGLNSSAGPRTIDWTVRQGNTPLFTAQTVCSGVDTGETCTNTSNNAASLDLRVQNQSIARLNLAFQGSGGILYNVISKIRYPANANLSRPNPVSISMPIARIIVPEAAPAALITTTVASIQLNTDVQFDTSGSVYPIGSYSYFRTNKRINSFITQSKPINVRGAGSGQGVTNPIFSFNEKVDELHMMLVLSSGEVITTVINLKPKFTPITGGS